MVMCADFARSPGILEWDIMGWMHVYVYNIYIYIK